MLHRRRMLSGLLFAPAIIRSPGLLMPIKPLDAEDLHWTVVVVRYDGSPHRQWYHRRIIAVDPPKNRLVMRDLIEPALTEL